MYLIQSKQIYPNVYWVKKGKDNLVYAPMKELACFGKRSYLLRFLIRFFSDMHSEPEPDPVSTMVSIDITHRCSLQCQYCAVDGGRDASIINEDSAKAAIKKVIGNSANLGYESAEVVFGGGGEPTMPWELFVELTSYAKDTASKAGIKAMVFIATNGMVSGKKAEWLAKNMSHIVLSFDGPPHIQDFHRPLKSNESSSVIIENTAKILKENDANFSIRATISSHNLNLTELVYYFLEFSPYYINFQPITERGRCQSSGFKTVDPLRFVEEFLKAKRIARKRDVLVTFPGTRTNILSARACHAYNGTGFVITSEGLVSACEKVLAQSDDTNNLFIYGKYDGSELSIQQQKVERLKNLVVDNIPYCVDCFCRWHCSGGCLSEHLKHSDGNPLSPRNHPMCYITRNLVWDELKNMKTFHIRTIS